MLGRRKALFALGGAFITLTFGGLFASRAFAQKPEIYTGIVAGKAAGGYDVVAYFTEGKPRKGSPRFATQWKGATWEFSSAANLEKFKANPAPFAPQYGGHCAYGLAHGYLVKGDPAQWRIVDGKLYLNYSADVQRQWLRDIPGFIQKSDVNWPGVLK